MRKDSDDLVCTAALFVLKISPSGICVPFVYAWFPKQHDERSYARLVDE